jgi:hypothetical protein
MRLPGYDATVISASALRCPVGERRAVDPREPRSLPRQPWPMAPAAQRGPAARSLRSPPRAPQQIGIVHAAVQCEQLIFRCHSALSSGERQRSSAGGDRSRIGGDGATPIAACVDIVRSKSERALGYRLQPKTPLTNSFYGLKKGVRSRVMC